MGHDQVNAPAQVQYFYSEIYNSFDAVLRTYENVIKNNRPQSSYPRWTWFYMTPVGLTITLEAVVLAKDSSAWKLYYSGIGLNNWISAGGKVAADGKYGAWKFYMPNSTTIDRSLVWIKNEQNVLTADATRFYDASPIDDIPGTYIDSKLVGQPDNSGSLKASDRGARIFEAQWDAAGAGSWAAYHPYTGQQTEGGSWR